MKNHEVSREDIVSELKRDLSAKKTLSGPVRKLRTSKQMTSEEIIAIRKELKMTQVQLAEILDLSIKTVQAYEQGRLRPSGIVAKIMRLMDRNLFIRESLKGRVEPEQYSDHVRLERLFNISQESNYNLHLFEDTIQNVKRFEAVNTGQSIEGVGEVRITVSETV